MSWRDLMSKRTQALKQLKQWGHIKGAQYSPYASWLRLMGCAIRGQDLSHEKALPCVNTLDLDHTTSKAAGGTFRRLLPLCHVHHMQRHDCGIITFKGIYGVDLQATAERIFNKWKRSPAGQEHLDYVEKMISDLS